MIIYFNLFCLLRRIETLLYLNNIKMALDFAAGCAGGAIIEKYFLINNFLPQVVLEYWLVIL